MTITEVASNGKEQHQGECIHLDQAESDHGAVPPNEVESWLEWASIFG